MKIWFKHKATEVGLEINPSLIIWLVNLWIGFGYSLPW